MISVVILNWNGRHHLETCLSSLQAQTFQDFEIILVDNGSTDDSVKFVKAAFPQVRVIALEKNFGFCGGNNAGIHVAHGDLIATLNNDTEVDIHWLEALNNAAERRVDVGFFTSKMLFFHQRNMIDDAGDDFHVAGFPAKRGWLHEDNAQYNIEREVFGACAGAAMYRKNMLEDVGGFDENFFANGEDIDLSFRAHLKGFKCLYVPNAVVYHKAGASIGKTVEWFYWIRRNQLWVLMKNMPSSLLVKYMPQIIIYNLLSLLYHSFQGRGQLIWRAYFDAFRDSRRVISQRKYIQAHRIVPDQVIEDILITDGLFGRMLHPMTAKSSLGGFYKLR